MFIKRWLLYYNLAKNQFNKDNLTPRKDYTEQFKVFKMIPSAIWKRILRLFEKYKVWDRRELWLCKVWGRSTDTAPELNPEGI
jgi:hypothetical protein